MLSKETPCKKYSRTLDERAPHADDEVALPPVKAGAPCLINHRCPLRLARTRTSPNTPNSLHQPDPRSSLMLLRETPQRPACATHLRGMR